jgi:SAM-dependent methyltransferase
MRAALRRLRRRARVAVRERGDRVACPCCGASFDRFADFRWPDRLCWRCGSLERHRALALWLDRHPELLAAGARVLHVAPEPSLRPRLSAPGLDYLAGDLHPGPGGVALDVTGLPFGDETFDAVVCNHVLEHVHDDAAAMGEIRRVLRPGGWASLMIPRAFRDVTDEEPGIDDPAEQLRRFGQEDHVRVYGHDYVDRLRAAGLEVEVVDLTAELRPEEVARHRLELGGAADPLYLARRPG